MIDSSHYGWGLDLRGILPGETVSRTTFSILVQVGEQSGTLVETMAHVSNLYREQARSAMATLTMLAGIAIWAMVAVVIIVLIFRLFFFYIGILNGALNG